MADRRRLKGWACAPAAIALAAAFAWSAYTSIGAADEPPAPSADSPAPQDTAKPSADPVTPPADQPPPAAPEQPAPTPPPVEPPPPAKEAPHPPKNLEPLPKDDAVTVLGKKVRGPAGEDMGRVVDLLLDRDAQPRAVVIDFGGFLGVGSRKIAIDWRLVRFVPDDRDAPLALSLGKAEVQAAPEYKDTAQPPVMVGQPPPILMPLDSDLPPVVSPETADGTQKALYASAARGLDGLNLIVANIQTGFGPFIAVFLTSQGWTQTAIGFALSIGTVTAMASQVPAGALVDAIPRKSIVALASIAAFAASALMFALWPIALSVYLAEILHGFSSCTLGPAIAALSLAIAGTASLGTRLGRNARFASIGNGVGAALMGACGYYLPERYVFVLTAVLTAPAIVAVLPISRFESALAARPIAAKADHEVAPERWRAIGRLIADPRLAVFAVCAALFTLANAALLPLVSSAVTKRATDEANLLIAACIILPQILVALLSPTVGRVADRRGRRIVVIVAFAAVGLRAFLFAWISDPSLVVAIQALDGVAGACFGVMVPLVTSDIAGRSGHFNLCLGIVGFAIGIGATISTSLAGWAADQFGEPAAFLTLALVAAAGAAVAGTILPETRPR